MTLKKIEDSLIENAFSLGVSDAKIISADLIPIDGKFAGFCKTPGCPNYGKSMSCPPNVMGPVKFKAHIRNFSKLLVFKFDIPWKVLLSEERHHVSRILHETAASLEMFALENGFKDAKGYAGGCCKNLFCRDHIYCRVLHDNGECRHPGQARESMSGMGVDFKALSTIAGWHIEEKFKENPDSGSTGLMAGSVLLKIE